MMLKRAVNFAAQVPAGKKAKASKENDGQLYGPSGPLSGPPVHPRDNAGLPAGRPSTSGTAVRSAAAAGPLAQPRSDSAGLSARPPQKVIVGSDCTGINGAAVALEILRVPFEEIFASESDPKVRETLLHNFPELRGRIYEDVQTRPNPNRRVDVYTARFPCQPKAGEPWSRQSTWHGKLVRPELYSGRKTARIPSGECAGAG